METGAVVENASLFEIDQNRRLYEFYVGWYLKGLPPGINHGGRALARAGRCLARVVVRIL